MKPLARIVNDGPDGYVTARNRFAQGQRVVFVQEFGPYFPGTRATIIAVPLMSVDDSYIVQADGCAEDHRNMIPAACMCEVQP